MRASLVARACVAVAVAAALSNCGGGAGGSSPTAPTTPPGGSTPAGQTVSVNIVGSTGNTAYNPNPVAASAGDTVVFRNSDTAIHHIVLDDGSADLGVVAPGGTSRGLTVRATEPMRFHCVNHPSMVGSINGSTAPEPDCPDPYGYGC